MEENVLRAVLELAVEIANTSELFNLNAESVCALLEMAKESQQEPSFIEATAAITVESQFGVIVKPGSYGVDIKKDNEEFLVEGVFFSPLHGELAYRGKHTTEKKKAEQENRLHGQATVIVPVKSIQPLTGVSEIVYYNYETGEIVESVPETNEF